MQCLDPRPFKGFVQVGIPSRPKLDNIEEGLQNRLVLIVAARCAQGHERLSVLQYDARRQGVPRARSGTQLRGAFRIQPELFTADAHADASVTQNHGAGNPAAARRAVEDVAVLVDDGDVGGVLDAAIHHLRDVNRGGGSRSARDVRGPVFPLFHFGIKRQRIAGLE